ncbi:PAS domain S-box protein [Rhodopirellula europaea]|uniref:histidine kinase n=1 Tax=Rhodopirellula europaea 6C TaxID=1263867 RepID=M2AZ19_9BACT|nr:PAS domain S-box protein [Rhodopirellula europaea]EMB14808.1 multi-sensor signal transduction histidine kinase [Rhodopirellula europaea 6C]
MKRSLILASVVACVGILMTAATVNVVRRSAMRYDQVRFEHLADRLHGEFQRRMHQSELGLVAVQCLFSASESVRYDEFTNLLSQINFDDEFLGAEAFGYLEIVPDTPEALGSLSDELVASGLPPLRLLTPQTAGVPYDRVGDDRLIPARFIVKFVQPGTRFTEVIGFDMGEDLSRRRTAELSARTGQACITPRLQLVGTNPNEANFLYMVPHYRGLPKNETERLESIVGWVGMVIDTSAVFEGLEAATGAELGYHLYIQEDNEGAFKVASSGELGDSYASHFKHRTSETIAGQRWNIEMFPTRVFATTASSLVWTVGLGGACCTILVSTLVFLLSSSAYRANRAAAKMTVDLRKLAMVAQRTTNSVIITDVDRRISWVNEGFTRISGYELHEVVGKTPGSFLQCEETDRRTIAEIRNALREKSGFYGELLNRRKNGEHYWVILDIQPLHDVDGEHIGYLAIKNDVTEAHQAAEELKQATQRIEYALDGGRMSIWDWDVQKDRIIYDSRCYSITGHTTSKDGDPAEAWFDRIHQEDLEHVKRETGRCIQGETEVFQIEWRCRQADGQYSWLFARGQAVQRAENGRATFLAGTTMEINERKRVETALIENTKRSQAMFYSSQDAILFLSDGEVLDCNPRALELFGFNSLEDMRGVDVLSLSPEYQPDGKRSDVEGDKIMQLIRRTGKRHFEWTHQTKDKRPIECDISAVSFELSGRVYEQLVIRDISSKKELQRHLAQTQKLESIGQLAAGVAHEINTPMQCVFGNVEYLNTAFDKAFALINSYRELRNDENPSELARRVVPKAEESCRFDSLQRNITESIQEAHDASNRVIDIVRAMKTMSHPGTSDKNITDLNQLIRDATTVARNHWKYVAHLELELDETVTPIPLFPAQMSQVILNLVVNSADAIEDRTGRESHELGTISVATRNIGDDIQIIVSDTGTGMPESVQCRVFDPFFTTKDVGKGTGQGLAIVYDVVVKQHGGTIKVDSAPGQGTRFTITLPANVDLESNLLPEGNEPGAVETGDAMEATVG